ncbi:type II secretion system F family protein [Sinomonas terrae]|uniref:Type II secretion system F family protein n=1 Tax=Sinomonas terrae TaxID=2908838 RepID=A0ABS9TZ20_9MICC|nr:type II secretion system F family protein [Sinomonas terrae]MCH6469687.1 type II secretion system F family protein [Sinomonas terrae]
MAPAVGLIGGLGLFLVWWACWEPPRSKTRSEKPGRFERALRQAGIGNVSPVRLAAASVAFGTLVTIVVASATAWPIGLCFGAFALGTPLTLVLWQAKRRARALREVWPDAVDHLRSAIRAGLSLPEALMQLGEKGPEILRPVFVAFAADFRSGGSFGDSLSRLKDQLADPTADRIVEALRLTRDVGGSDLGRLLSTLGECLRENLRTRSELEARQSWTVNGARLAVAAPWVVLLLLAARPEAMAAYARPAGLVVLGGGLIVSFVCYRLMLRIGALPPEERVLR